MKTSFLKYLEEMGIAVTEEKIFFEDDEKFKDIKTFLNCALSDILSQKSSFFKELKDKGIKVSFSYEFPKGKTEFNIEDQVNLYLKDMGEIENE